MYGDVGRNRLYPQCVADQTEHDHQFDETGTHHDEKRHHAQGAEHDDQKRRVGQVFHGLAKSPCYVHVRMRTPTRPSTSTSSPQPIVLP